MLRVGLCRMDSAWVLRPEEAEVSYVLYSLLGGLILWGLLLAGAYVAMKSLV